jgi:hypothetical protein
MPLKTSKWEKEFRRMFGETPNVERFISTLLSSQKAEMIDGIYKEVDNLGQWTEVEDEHDELWGQSMLRKLDVLELLNKYKGK